MAETTKIEWCDSTWNPWIGCTKVSPACDYCYAEVSTPSRTRGIEWGAGKPRQRTSEENWKQPLRWNARPYVECMSCGWRGEEADCKTVQNPAGFHPPTASAKVCPQCMEPTMKLTRRRVFCASLADVFDNEVPDAWRHNLFQLIKETSNLDWLLLTKRIGNAERYLSIAWPTLSANVWLGATICNQAEANRDIPKLLRVPAAVRFLSIEPMLGPIDFYKASAAWSNTNHPWRGGPILQGIHWVIVGGESGPNARPMHPDWARSLRDQCACAGVPFLFKQWGEHAMTYDRDRDDPDWRRCAEWDRKPGRWINLAGGHGFHGERVHYAHRVGKKAAGRTLDGRIHHEFPVVRHA